MVTTIQIDKKIPPPEEKKRNFYPYKSMEIGESFFVPEVETRLMCNNNNRVAKATGKKFVARREGNGVRVWRIA